LSLVKKITSWHSGRGKEPGRYAGKTGAPLTRKKMELGTKKKRCTCCEKVEFRERRLAASCKE